MARADGGSQDRRGTAGGLGSAPVPAECVAFPVPRVTAASGPPDPGCLADQEPSCSGPADPVPCGNLPFHRPGARARYGCGHPGHPDHLEPAGVPHPAWVRDYLPADGLAAGPCAARSAAGTGEKILADLAVIDMAADATTAIRRRQGTVRLPLRVRRPGGHISCPSPAAQPGAPAAAQQQPGPGTRPHPGVGARQLTRRRTAHAPAQRRTGRSGAAARAGLAGSCPRQHPAVPVCRLRARSPLGPSRTPGRAARGTVLLQCCTAQAVPGCSGGS